MYNRLTHCDAIFLNVHYIFVMEILLIWLILSYLCGTYATNKGKSFWTYFFLSFILTPLIGFIALLILGENKDELEKKSFESGESKKCPFCAEIIKMEAIKCRYCGEMLNDGEIFNKPIDLQLEDVTHNLDKDDSKSVPSENTSEIRVNERNYITDFFAFIVILSLVILCMEWYTGFSNWGQTEGKISAKNTKISQNIDKSKVEELRKKECVEVIRCLSAGDVAKEYGRTEQWAVANYRVSVWEKPTHQGKGKKVGEMLCGSKAMIIDTSIEDYKIISPLDQSIGWVNEVQISGTSFQNPITNESCNK